MAIGADARAGTAGGTLRRPAWGLAWLAGVFTLGFFIGKSFDLKSSGCTSEVLRRTAGSPPRTMPNRQRSEPA
jgi:hypothetical protein